ncbi:hypothetical protein [Streptomyces sp. NPDC058434]|uniref:hypothetical protein n=1 Tax=Streptomyces sp. NPDC058434 TaxID=3346498 RepID=UPI0036568D2C
MRYILFHARAHEVLGGGNRELFRDSWLMPALANFTAVSTEWPDEPRLLNMKEEIMSQSALRRAYEDVSGWIRAHGDLHVSNEPRPFWDPRRRLLTQVHVLTETHLGYQKWPVYRSTFVFLD